MPHYHVEPPFPANADWSPAPVFVSTESLGVVPNHQPRPEPGPLPIPSPRRQGAAGAISR